MIFILAFIVSHYILNGYIIALPLIMIRKKYSNKHHVYCLNNHEPSKNNFNCLILCTPVTLLLKPDCRKVELLWDGYFWVD